MVKATRRRRRRKIRVYGVKLPFDITPMVDAIVDSGFVGEVAFVGGTHVELHPYALHAAWNVQWEKGGPIVPAELPDRMRGPCVAFEVTPTRQLVFQF